MFDINKIVRPNIQSLQAYSSARDEFTGEEGIFLDANENPYGDLNRYPDPYQRKLKRKLAEIKGVDADQIFIGNGSDEVIDLAMRIFCEPGMDQVLTFEPTYGMYDVSAEINNIELIKDPLNENFQIDLDAVLARIQNPLIKLIFICSPNNPTGNIIPLEDIENILKQFNGIVIVDEAYIDFSSSKSAISILQKYPNLIVSQTFSKARGLAAARVGLAYASRAIIDLFNKVKPPYNVSLLNQEAAINALEKEEDHKECMQAIQEEKKNLYDALNNSDNVTKIYPSEANFYLVEVKDANKIYNELIDQKVIIRNRNKVIRNCIRITVGTAAENKKLIKALNSIK